MNCSAALRAVITPCRSPWASATIPRAFVMLVRSPYRANTGNGVFRLRVNREARHGASRTMRKLVGRRRGRSRGTDEERVIPLTVVVDRTCCLTTTSVSSCACQHANHMPASAGVWPARAPARPNCLDRRCSPTRPNHTLGDSMGRRYRATRYRRRLTFALARHDLFAF